MRLPRGALLHALRRSAAWRSRVATAAVDRAHSPEVATEADVPAAGEAGRTPWLFGLFGLRPRWPATRAHNRSPAGTGDTEDRRCSSRRPPRRAPRAMYCPD